MERTSPAPPGASELFWSFARVGVSGFGGVLPWIRRAVVDQHRWLSSQEFSSLLGVCQFLPGPNVMNLAICIGNRFHGARGAVSASLGLLSGPMIVIIVLGLLYERYGALPAVQAVLGGISSVGAGLILGAGVRMARDLRRHRALLAIATATLLAIALLRWPLLPVLLGLIPVSIWLAARSQRANP